jgi:flavin reductase (DIM6/NTAB) family NADH-FMN oxidoreductase RutF
VAVVTCRIDDRPWGMTVTAFAPVAVEPPTVLVSLGTGTASAHGILGSGRFGVSLLGSGQRDAAAYASDPGAAKFLEAFVDGAGLRSETPAVGGALAHLDCEIDRHVAVADHTIFIGRVSRAYASPGGAPLLYFRRGYGELSDAALDSRRGP